MKAFVDHFCLNQSVMVLKYYIYFCSHKWTHFWTLVLFALCFVKIYLRLYPILAQSFPRLAFILITMGKYKFSNGCSCSYSFAGSDLDHVGCAPHLRPQTSSAISWPEIVPQHWHPWMSVFSRHLSPELPFTSSTSPLSYPAAIPKGTYPISNFWPSPHPTGPTIVNVSFILFAGHRSEHHPWLFSVSHPPHPFQPHSLWYHLQNTSRINASLLTPFWAKPPSFLIGIIPAASLMIFLLFFSSITYSQTISQS